MKILHVITSLRTGGAEKLMVDLLPRMASKGHEVELCVFDGVRTAFYDELEGKGIKIHHFHINGSVYNPLNIIRLRRLMNRGWDVVHTHNTAPQLFAAICSSFSAFPLCGKGKPLMVTTEHNTTNRRRAWGWYWRIDRWMFCQYKAVICISDQAETNHREHMAGDHCENVCTIYNGIDYQRYSTAQAAADVRALGKRIITNVAGFRPQKDQPTLIRAMKHLPEEYILCLVGDGECRIACESLAESEGVSGRVHFLGLRTDVPEVLAASDFVTMCSHYEGLSLSSLEGMASGKPFLASDVDGLHEIVEGHGVLVAHEDAKGFADAIMKLDRDEDYRNTIIKQCQAKAAQYDINVMVDKYLGVYTALADSKG